MAGKIKSVSMQLPLFQVDAFTDKIFGGNPAAICPLDHWLPDDLMQKIAIENSVAETAFFIPSDDGFEVSMQRLRRKSFNFRKSRNIFGRAYYRLSLADTSNDCK